MLFGKGVINHWPRHLSRVLSTMDSVMCVKETSMMILAFAVVPGKHMTQSLCISCPKEGVNPHKDSVRG